MVKASSPMFLKRNRSSVEETKTNSAKSAAVAETANSKEEEIVKKAKTEVRAAVAVDAEEDAEAKVAMEKDAEVDAEEDAEVITTQKDTAEEAVADHEPRVSTKMARQLSMELKPVVSVKVTRESPEKNGIQWTGNLELDVEREMTADREHVPVGVKTAKKNQKKTMASPKKKPKVATAKISQQMLVKDVNVAGMKREKLWWKKRKKKSDSLLQTTKLKRRLPTCHKHREDNTKKRKTRILRKARRRRSVLR